MLIIFPLCLIVDTSRPPQAEGAYIRSDLVAPSVTYPWCPLAKEPTDYKYSHKGTKKPLYL